MIAKKIIKNNKLFLPTIVRYFDGLDTKKLVFTVVVILLVSQIFVVSFWFIRDFSRPFAGSEIYGQMAKNIIDNGIYSIDGNRLTASRPPLYPLFLTLSIAISRDNYGLIAILFQSMLDISSGILLFFISLRIFRNKLGAFISVLLYGLHFILHLQSTNQIDTILFIFLVMLFFYLTMGKKSIATYIILSCLAALAYLTRVTGIFLFPVMFIDLLNQKYQIKEIFKYIFAISVTALIVVAPWHIYVYRNFHILSPSTNGGNSSYHGNNPDFQTIYPYVYMEYYTPFVHDFMLEHDIDTEDEVAVDEFLGNEAWKFVQQNPMLFVRNGIIKIFSLYSPLLTPIGKGDLVGEVGNITLENFKLELSVSLRGIAYTFIYVIMVLGIILFIKNITLYSKQQKIQVSLMLIFVILLTILHISLSYGTVRYRLPLDPLLIILTGQGYSLLFEDKNRKTTVEPSPLSSDVKASGP